MRPAVAIGLAAGGAMVAGAVFRRSSSSAPAGTFAADFAADAAERAAELGALVGGRPKLTPKQGEAWIAEWLDRWATGHRADRERFRVLRDIAFPPVNPGAELEPPAGAWRTADLRTWLGRAAPRSPLGGVWDELRRLHALARNATPVARDQPWAAAALAHDTLRAFARALDVAAADDPENLFEAGARVAARVPRLFGEGVGFMAEHILAPFLGAALSSGVGNLVTVVAPYAIAAGVGYVAIRRLT